MSTMQHHAIVILTSGADAAQRHHAKATQLCGQLVSPIVHCTGYADHFSFFVAPDVQKRENEEVKVVDRNRVALREYLAQLPSNEYTQWVEVSFGDLGSRVVADWEYPSEVDYQSRGIFR